MAKGEQKSNKEKKKPKQDRPKEATGSKSAFAGGKAGPAGEPKHKG